MVVDDPMKGDWTLQVRGEEPDSTLQAVPGPFLLVGGGGGGGTP